MQNINKKLDIKKLKIALMHEYLVKIGGGERVLKVLTDLFPKADIFTIVYDPDQVRKILKKPHQIKSSFLQHFLGGVSKYQLYLPWMAKAVESLDFSKYNLVISDNHSFSKGVITGNKTFHINYCYTPTRYLWLNPTEHIKRTQFFGPFKKIIPYFINRLKKWDFEAAKRPDIFVSICKNVQKRVKKYYNRNSQIIYPPIDWDFFRPTGQTSDFFLYISRLEPHKKPDLAVLAFVKNGLPLKVVGTGSMFDSLKASASSNIEFLGEVSDTKLRDLYSAAKAVIFPQEEDFGLVPLEAAACGTPTIAFAKGGALETVIEGKTGTFFHQPNPASLNLAITKFNRKKYLARSLRSHAKKFSIQSFQIKFLQMMVREYSRWLKNSKNNK
ncbi:MAG TPA: glycosyltransferase [Patescibacteria group bacterium]|nr:glycosyltransferase [Patescibacteria group bacterium]